MLIFFANWRDHRPVDFLKVYNMLVWGSNLAFARQFKSAVLPIVMLAMIACVCQQTQAQSMWCPADLNRDHVVNQGDLVVLLLNWGRTSTPIPADINKDGWVNKQDMAILFLAWGQCPTTITPNVAWALCNYVDHVSGTPPMPQLPVPEGWQIIWEPMTDVGGSYAVVFQKLGTPCTSCNKLTTRQVTYALAIQGTQNISDVLNDFAITPQVSFPSIAAAQIATGSQTALMNTLNLLQATNGDAQSLQSFLMSLNRRDQLLVTGHSLGGNVTSVIVPWIASHVPAFGPNTMPLSRLPSNLTAITFAAPTAGNPAFATFLNNNPANYAAYFNSNDVVPHAWATSGVLSIDNIDALYSPVGASVPASVTLFLNVKKLAMQKAGVTYMQTQGTMFTYPLQTPPPGTSNLWTWQLSYQHNDAYDLTYP